MVDRYWGVFTSLIVINIVFSFASRYYFTRYNMMNILDHSAISLILATGMVFVLATGGIDLSVGSTLAFTGLVVAILMKSGLPIILAIVVGILTGIVIGIVNGLVIFRFGLQPFIVTLAMLSIVRGLALVISGGNPVVGMPEEFLTFFAGPRLLANGFYYALLLAVIAAIVLSRTRFGQYVQSVGGSEEATYLCGINTGRIKIAVYAIAGGLAAFSSLMFMAGMDAAEPIAGLTTEWMEAIAAPVIGGNTLDGGRGFIFGAVIGVLILSCIKSGLNMMAVGQHFQQIAIGAVIVAAVIIDSLRNRPKVRA